MRRQAQFSAICSQYNCLVMCRIVLYKPNDAPYVALPRDSYQREDTTAMIVGKRACLGVWPADVVFDSPRRKGAHAGPMERVLFEPDRNLCIVRLASDARE